MPNSNSVSEAKEIKEKMSPEDKEKRAQLYSARVPIHLDTQQGTQHFFTAAFAYGTFQMGIK